MRLSSRLVAVSKISYSVPIEETLKIPTHLLAFMLGAFLSLPTFAQDIVKSGAIPAIVDGKAPVDFASLRTQYGTRDDYDAICDDKILTNQMVVASNNKKDDVVLAATASRLTVCPVDISAHLLRATTLYRQGKMDEAGEQFRWATGLMRTILDSGDGKTARTAFVTISLREETAVLSYFGLLQRSQTLELDPPRDRIEAVDAQGSMHTVYFFPRAHFIRLAKSMNVPPMPGVLDSQSAPK